MSVNPFLDQFLKSRGMTSATSSGLGGLVQPTIIGKSAAVAPGGKPKKRDAANLKELIASDPSKKEVRKYFESLAERLRDEKEAEEEEKDN
jgi:hypothetical protein